MAAAVMEDIDDVRDQVLAQLPELVEMPEQERERLLEEVRARLDHDGVVDRRAFLMNVTTGVVTIIGTFLWCPDFLKNRAEGGWTIACATVVALIAIVFGIPRLKRRMMIRELWKILPTRCDQCGCDLRNRSAHQCPKCGSALPARDRNRLLRA